MGKLQREIKQRKPFRNLGEEAVLNVWRTGDFIARRLHELLKTGGISQTQYNVLRILRGAGADGIACGEIAGRMLTHDPDITRLMDRLVRRGLARRTRVRRDRRVILAGITPEGASLLEEMDPLVARLVDQIIGHMQEPQLKTLIRLLEKTRNGELRNSGKSLAARSRSVR
jgi:DNA-binding MarR family transcriptional regulator